MFILTQITLSFISTLENSVFYNSQKNDHISTHIGHLSLQVFCYTSQFVDQGIKIIKSKVDPNQITTSTFFIIKIEIIISKCY